MLSIIIPAYNAEKTIIRCLNSIREQSYKNYECIVINDGSSDSTQETVIRFTGKDPSFRLINMMNGGVSRARNAGISAAKGEYITFVDSDDILNVDCLGKLMERVEKEKPDIMLFGYERERENGKLYSWGVLNTDVCRTDSIKCEEWCAALKYGLLDTCWGKIYKRSANKEVRFDERISWSEDTIFVLSSICASNTIAFSSITGYRHIYSPNGLDRRFDKSKPKYLNYYYKSLLRFEDRLGIYGSEWTKVRDIKISREMMQMINALVDYEMTKAETDTYLQNLFSSKEIKKLFKNGILLDNHSFKVKPFAWFNSFTAWKTYIALKKGLGRLGTK